MAIDNSVIDHPHRASHLAPSHNVAANFHKDDEGPTFETTYLSQLVKVDVDFQNRNVSPLKKQTTLPVIIFYSWVLIVHQVALRACRSTS